MVRVESSPESEGLRVRCHCCGTRMLRGLVAILEISSTALFVPSPISSKNFANRFCFFRALFAGATALAALSIFQNREKSVGPGHLQGNTA